MAEWKKILLEGDAAVLTNTAPSDIGTSADAGSSSEAARADHVHKIGSGAINSSSMFASGVIDTAAIGDSQVTTSKINIDADLSFNNHEADDLLLDTAGTSATGATAKVVFNTGDSHPYVYV